MDTIRQDDLLQNLRSRYRANYFEPFVVKLADGRELPVHAREFLSISPHGNRIILCQRDDSWDMIAINEIKEVANFPMTFVGGNKDARQVLSEAGALQFGHFLLSSGLHSPGYFQCATLLEKPAVAEHIAREVAEKARHLAADVILSPALGAIIWGHELARALGIRHIFAERPTGKFELRRGFSLAPGERVLMAENVVTTGGSVVETAEMARALGAEIAGYALIVDRSAGRFAPPESVISFATLNAETYDPAACPLCAAGVPVTKPGSRNLKQS